MNRIALLTATALTAFVLVIIGAITSTVAGISPTTLPATVATTAAAGQQGNQQQIEVVQPTNAQEQQQTGMTARSAYGLSAEQAAAITESVAPDGAARSATPERVNFGGTAAYEVVFDRGNIYVDAHSGAVLSNSIVAPPALVPASSSQQTTSVGGDDNAYERYERLEHSSGERHEHDERDTIARHRTSH